MTNEIATSLNMLKHFVEYSLVPLFSRLLTSGLPSFKKNEDDDLHPVFYEYLSVSP